MGCIEKLSRARIARIERRGKYGDGGGLYLQVSRALVKSWVFRYKIGEAEHFMGLGPLHAVDLKEAREKACWARALLVKGIDPMVARAMQTRTCDSENKTSHKTFDECAAEYIDSHRSEWKSPKHKTQWENSLRTYASPHFGKTNVRKIDTSLVLRALGPIWTAKTETAARLRERIERVLSFAATRGYRDENNPARWQGHLEELLPKPSKIKTVRHHPAMPY
jgi:hypothetical protein